MGILGPVTGVTGRIEERRLIARPASSSIGQFRQ
jgi:hypothetical protein